MLQQAKIALRRKVCQVNTIRERVRNYTPRNRNCSQQIMRSIRYQSNHQTPTNRHDRFNMPQALPQSKARSSVHSPKIRVSEPSSPNKYKNSVKSTMFKFESATQEKSSYGLEHLREKLERLGQENIAIDQHHKQARPQYKLGFFKRKPAKVNSPLSQNTTFLDFSFNQSQDAEPFSYCDTKLNLPLKLPLHKVMKQQKMLIYLLLTLSSAQTFTASEVKPSEFKVGITTGYSFSMTLSVSNSDGILQIVFPSDYNGLSFSNFSCSSMTSNLQNCAIQSCNRSGLTVSVDFNCPTGAVGTKFNLQLDNVPNPQTAVTTASFGIQSRDQSGALKEQKLTGLTITFEPFQFSTFLISPQNDTAGAANIWEITAVTHSVPIEGSILVLNLPTRLEGADGYCPNVLSCQISAGAGTVNATCNCVQGQLGVTLSNLSQSSFVVYLNQMNNPISTTAATGFSAMIQYNGQNIEITNPANQPTVKVNQPGYMSLNINLAANYKVSEITNYELGMLCSNPIPQTAKMRLEFPSQLTVSGEIDTNVQGGYGLKSQLTDYDVSSNRLNINNLFYQPALTEQITINIINIQNPSTTNKTDAIKATILDASNGMICQSTLEDSAKFVATPAEFANMQITPTIATVGVQTTYRITIRPEKSLPSGSAIKIVLPSTISFAQGSTCTAFTGISQAASCNFVSGELRITGGFPTGYNGVGDLMVEVSQVTNPPSTRPSAGFKATIYPSNDFSTGLVVQGDSQGFAQGIVIADVGVLTDVIVSSQSIVTGEVTRYTFEITTSTQMLTGGQIQVQLPSEVELQDINAPCTSIQGFNSQISCTNTANSITVKNGFASGNSNPGTIKFSITSVRNPQSTKPTGDFIITTKDMNGVTSGDGYKIQTLEKSGFSVTEPHNLQSAGVTSNSDVVGKTGVEFTFSVNPFNPLLTNSNIQIKPPIGIEFPSSPICVGISAIISGISCINQNSDLRVQLSLSSNTVNEIQFKVTGMSNPISTAATATFQILTRTDIYQIDNQTSGITLQVNTPAAMDLLLIELADTGISQVTSYKFRLRTSHTVPSSGLILVTFPSSILITSNLSCTVQGNSKGCENIGSNTVKVYAFANDFAPGEIEFAISGIRNGPNEGTSNTFGIYTALGNSSKIDQNLTGTVNFTCTSPCETCSGSPTACTSCDSTSSTPYFWDSGCHTVCKEGTLDANNTKTCSKCNDVCKTCVGSIDNCNSCDTNGTYQYLQGTTCVSQCDPQYLQTPSKQCIKCNDACLTCDGTINTCTSCPEAQKLYKGGCEDACPQATVDKHGECFDCSEGCTSCQDEPTKCTQCDTDLLLYQNTCVAQCPAGISLKEGNECKPCANGCFKCADTTTNCTECTGGYSLYNNTCVADCPDNYAAIDAECQQCSEECKACEGSIETCTECPQGKLKYGNRCVSTCPQGESVQVGNICSSCISTCLTCGESVDKCLSCTGSRALYNNSCIETCPSNMIKSQGQCVTCDLSCSTCGTSAYQCTSCPEGTYLYDGTCNETCPPNITVSVGNECVACSEACGTCTGTPSTCTSCFAELYVLEGQCVDQCPAGYDLTDGVCEKSTVGEQCAEGCTSGKLNNDKCDPECSFAACDFDNGKCTSGGGSIVIEEEKVEYEETPPIEEAPFPSTLIGALGVGVVGLSKFLSAGTSFYVGSIGVLGAVECASWIAVFAGIGAVDDKNGRELIDTNDDEMVVAFCLVLLILLVNVILNCIFLGLYYFQIYKKDAQHMAWVQKHKTPTIIIAIISAILSFKCMRLIYSNLFNLPYFKAQINKHRRILRPILIISCVSIALVSLPIIAVLVFVLTEFGSGNIVWLLALDSLIVTVITSFFCIYDIIKTAYLISRKQALQTSSKVSVSGQATPAVELTLDNHSMHIFSSMVTSKIKGQEELETERSMQITSDNAINIQREFSERYLRLQTNTSISIDGRKDSGKKNRIKPPGPIRVMKAVPLGEPDSMIERDANEPEHEYQSALGPLSSESSGFNVKDIQYGWGNISGNISEIEEEEPTASHLLKTIDEESQLDLSKAEVDPDDLECIKVPLKPSGVNVLVKKEFKGGNIIGDDGLESGEKLDNSNYVVKSVNPQDVHFGIVQWQDRPKPVTVKRSFKGSRIMDIIKPNKGKWLLGRTVMKESDWDFERATIDPADTESVIVRHKPTGYRARVQKAFIGVPRLNPTTGLPMLEQGVIQNYNPENLKVDERDVHYGQINEDGEHIMVRRNFIGARIMDVLPPEYDYGEGEVNGISRTGNYVFTRQQLGARDDVEQEFSPMNSDSQRAFAQLEMSWNRSQNISPHKDTIYTNTSRMRAANISNQQSRTNVTKPQSKQRKPKKQSFVDMGTKTGLEAIYLQRLHVSKKRKNQPPIFNPFMIDDSQDASQMDKTAVANALSSNKNAEEMDIELIRNRA